VDPEILLGRRPRWYDAQAAAAAGLLAGLIAGGVLALLLGAMSLFAGRGALTGLRVVATTFMGPAAFSPARTWTAVLEGLMAHFGLSLAFGLAFGLAAYGWQRATVVWASVVWGLLVYSFMVFLALPVANPLLARGEVGFVPLFVHLLFGVIIGICFEILRFRTGGDGAPRRGATFTIQPHERIPGPPQH
jgi:hypothetical protein